MLVLMVLLMIKRKVVRYSLESLQDCYVLLSLFIAIPEPDKTIENVLCH
jgi:hypothetical protein